MSPSSSAERDRAVSSTQVCVTCGHRFVGTYCGVCGEKVLTEQDKRLPAILRDVITGLVLIDGKLWRTLRAVVLNPGRFSRDHAEGRRRPYMKPLTFFLLANLVYFLLPLMATFNTTLALQVGGGHFVHSELARDMVEREIAKRGVSHEQYTELYNRKTKELSKLLLILVALFFSLPLWLLHREKFYYSETFVLSLEMMSFIILFAVQAVGGVAWVLFLMGWAFAGSEAFVTIGAFGLLLFFLVRAERTFFQARGPQAWLRAAGGTVSFIVTLYIYRALLFFVTFYWI